MGANTHCVGITSHAPASSIVPPPTYATQITGYGNGTNNNLSVPNKGTATGPVSSNIIGWTQANINGSLVWVPYAV